MKTTPKSLDSGAVVQAGSRRSSRARRAAQVQTDPALDNSKLVAEMKGLAMDRRAEAVTPGHLQPRSHQVTLPPDGQTINPARDHLVKLDPFKTPHAVIDIPIGKNLVIELKHDTTRQDWKFENLEAPARVRRTRAPQRDPLETPGERNVTDIHVWSAHQLKDWPEAREAAAVLYLYGRPHKKVMLRIKQQLPK